MTKGLIFTEDDRKAVAAKSRERDRAQAAKQKAKAKKGAGGKTPTAPAGPAEANTTEPAKANSLVVESQKIADEIMENKETIIHCHNTIMNSLKESLYNAFAAGAVLLRQKKLIEKFEFGNWINKNLPFSIRTAQRYMQLYEYKKVLLKNNIETITDAYAYIFNEPVSDNVAEVDDATKVEHSVKTNHPDIDKPPKPKRHPKGPASEVVISKKLIADMKKGNYPYKGRKGCYAKFIIGISNNMQDRELITEWLIEAQKYLRPGGKIIFVKRDGC